MSSLQRMHTRRPWSALVFALAALIVIVADQLTKGLILRGLAGEESDGRVDIVSPWLALVYVENRGAAFGLLQGYSDLLLVLAIVLVIGITIFFQRMGTLSPLMPVATGLIVGGAIGNIIDRIRLGFVVDFVAVGPWPTFNVADSAITVGTVLLFVALIFGKEDSSPLPERSKEVTASR